LPRWAEGAGADLFDFEAKSPSGSAQTRDAMRSRMRTALAERFGLKFHIASKMMPVYFLVVAPGGSKLMRPADPAREAYTMQGFVGWNRDFVVARPASPEDVAAYFVQSRPISDHTGLKSYYDIDIPPTGEAPTRNAVRADPLVLARELLDKLGLELVPGRAPVPVMTVHRIERPSPN